jgi:hypothetical protein
MEILSVYVIKRDFVTIRDLYGEMKIFPAKLRYNQRFAIAGYVKNREYCTMLLPQTDIFSRAIHVVGQSQAADLMISATSLGRTSISW